MARGQPKGVSGNPNGRPKGIPNKITMTVKEMIVNALKESGGVEYLKEQAQKNPVAFLGLIGRIVPLTVAGDKNNPLTINVTDDDRELINRYIEKKQSMKPTITIEQGHHDGTQREPENSNGST